MSAIVEPLTVEVQAVRPVLREVAVNHNTQRHVVFVMAQALAIFVLVMAGSLFWVWAKTTIAHLAETTTGSARRVMVEELGKNKITEGTERLVL